MRAVLEDVEEGHSCQTEAMHKQRLVFSLHEMRNDHGHSEVLGIRERSGGTVDVWAEEEGSYKVDYEGP